MQIETSTIINSRIYALRTGKVYPLKGRSDDQA